MVHSPVLASPGIAYLLWRNGGRGRVFRGGLGLVPPSSAQGLQQCRGVGVAARRGDSPVKQRLQFLALRIEQSQLAYAAGAVTLGGNPVGILRVSSRFAPGLHGLRIMLDSAQSIRYFPERLQHSLLVDAAGFFIGSQCPAPLRPQRSAVKDRLRQGRSEVPDVSPVGETGAYRSNAP